MTIDGEEEVSADETQLVQQDSSPSLFTRTLQKPLGIGIIVGTYLECPTH